MFNGTKKELNQIRSEAGQFRKEITDKFNSNSGQLNKRIADVEKELDFADRHPLAHYSFAQLISYEPLPRRTLKTVIKSLESRLDEQEKMTRMILAHLGVEYAKTTEETATGRQEKEVLRKIKKQTK